MARGAKNGSCNPDEPILITQQSAIFQQKHQSPSQRVGAQGKTQGPPTLTQSKLGGYSREEPPRSPFGQSQGPSDLSSKPSKYHSKLPKLKTEVHAGGAANVANPAGRREAGSTSPGMYGSTVAMRTYEAQNPTTTFALKHKRLSSNLTSKDKENFKNQFDTFRTIYQGENHAASKSAESHSSHKNSSFKKSAFQSQDGEPETAERGSQKSHKLDNIDQHDISLRSPNVMDETIQHLESGPGQMEVAQDLLDMNLAELEGQPKRNPPGQEAKVLEGQQTAQANDEKVRHLKQFIYMVDLFNVLETESKQAQLSPSPENNVQAHIEKRNKLYE